MSVSQLNEFDGPLSRVPPGTRVYAIGDCHGCNAQVRALHMAILADCQSTQGRGRKSGPGPGRLVVVYLGDYIDRGPDTRSLLDILIGQALPGFERVFLMGNHENVLLRLIDGGPVPRSWRLDGADATLMSYGLDPDVWPDDGTDLRAAIRARLPASHERFMRALRYSHVEGDYFFTHAGVRPGVALDAQDEEDLLWIREPFLDSTDDHGKVIVHGHTPVEKPEIRANRIGIDTGAVYGGVLTALVLEGRERRFLCVR